MFLAAVLPGTPNVAEVRSTRDARQQFTVTVTVQDPFYSEWLTKTPILNLKKTQTKQQHLIDQTA